MKIAHRIILVFANLVIFLNTHSQDWLWAQNPKYYTTADNNIGGGDAISIATDNKGNAYEVSIAFFCKLVYADDTINSYSSGTSYLVKYNTNGAVQWTRQSIHGNGSCYANSVTTDNEGSVYITGTVRDTVTLGDTILTGSHFASAFLAKFDENGTLLWWRHSEEKGTSSVYDVNGVVTDNSGNVYITGSFIDTTTFGNVTLGEPRGGRSHDMFLVKYDSQGSVIWARKGDIYSSSSIGSVGNAVATDRQNNVYVTGKFYDTLGLGNHQLVGTTSNGDIFVVKYDRDGTVLWCKQSISDGSESNAITTDKWGNVYIAGDFVDSISFDAEKLTNTPYYGAAVLIVRFDSNGKVVWGKTAQTLVSTGYQGWGIVADTNSNIYFTATAYHPGFSLQFGSKVFASPKNNSPENSLILQLDTSGNALCGTVVPMGGDDKQGIAVDPSGKYIYMASDYDATSDTLIIGNSVFTFKGDLDAEIPFVLRWQPCNLVLSATFNKPLEDKEVVVYPNPSTRGSVIVSVSSELLGSKLELYNIEGQAVFASVINNEKSEIIITGLNAGIYWFCISNPKASIVRKMIKL